MEGIHKYTARYFYAEATFTCRLFPKINNFLFLGSWLAVILFMHDTLQLNNFSISFSSWFDESGGDFLFSKKFSKTPPQDSFPISNK